VFVMEVAQFGRCSDWVVGWGRRFRKVKSVYSSWGVQVGV
jgi:hypothetical protein